MNELAFLHWLQNLSRPWLDILMGIFTYAGTPYFYLPAICFLYWCVDVTATIRLLVLMLASVYLNSTIKELTMEPRPFQVDPTLKPRFVQTATGYSFPSGHAQDSVVFWGYLMMVIRRTWIYIVGALMIVLVSFSRLYLGVHWPHDVLGGLLIGGIVLGCGYVALRLLAGTPVKATFPSTLVLALIPLVFFLLIPSPEAALSMGLLCGAIIGYQVERRYVRFPVHLSLWKQAVKLIIGLATLLLLVGGLLLLLAPLIAAPTGLQVVPGQPSAPPTTGFFQGPGQQFPTFGVFILGGAWATLGAPFIFRLIFGKEKEGPAA